MKEADAGEELIADVEADFKDVSEGDADGEVIGAFELPEASGVLLIEKVDGMDGYVSEGTDVTDDDTE